MKCYFNNVIANYYQYLLIEKQYSSNTITAYLRDIYQFQEIIKIDNIKAIDDQIIMNYLQYLTNHYENKTIHRKISSINNFFKYLVINNYVVNNPLANINLAKIKQTLPQYLTQEQINYFLNNIALDTFFGLRNKAMFEILYASGMRVSELINVKITDLNLEEQLIKVYGKGNKQRIIPLNNTSCKYLKLYLNNSYPQINKKQSLYLFLNQRGQPLTRQGFYQVLQKEGQRLGLTTITPHVFRHSIATHMLNNGANLKIVQEMLGHKNINTTQIYTHLNNDALNKEYQQYHIYGDNYQKE